MRWGQYKISYIDNENKDKSKHLNISKGGLQGYLQISSEMHQKTSFIRYESMQSLEMAFLGKPSTFDRRAGWTFWYDWYWASFGPLKGPFWPKMPLFGPREVSDNLNRVPASPISNIYQLLIWASKVHTWTNWAPMTVDNAIYWVFFWDNLIL